MKKYIYTREPDGSVRFSLKREIAPDAYSVAGCAIDAFSIDGKPVVEDDYIIWRFPRGFNEEPLIKTMNRLGVEI
jgi:hypothetical protein